MIFLFYVVPLGWGLSPLSVGQFFRLDYNQRLYHIKFQIKSIDIQVSFGIKYIVILCFF